MAILRTAGLVKYFESLPDPLKKYFVHFPKLVFEYPSEVSLSYLFAQIELAQNMIVYGGVVKLHKVDSEIARSAVNSHHMTRERFRNLYKVITEKNIKKETVDHSKKAENVRDRILHGKKVSDEEKRDAIHHALQYAALLNEQALTDVGFRPFGKMKGFKGRAKSLEKSTSKWVLAGIEIISKPNP